MSIENILAAVGILLAVGGASIKIIESIINQVTADKFKQLDQDLDNELVKVANRLNRLERRMAILETRVTGDSDTFSHE